MVLIQYQATMLLQVTQLKINYNPFAKAFRESPAEQEVSTRLVNITFIVHVFYILQVFTSCLSQLQ